MLFVLRLYVIINILKKFLKECDKIVKHYLDLDNLFYDFRNML